MANIVILYKKPKHVKSHVFDETTNVFATPHEFACLITPAT